MKVNLNSLFLVCFFTAHRVAVLQEAPSMNDGGGIVWQLALCLMVAWIIVFFCLIKGIKSSGKVNNMYGLPVYTTLTALWVHHLGLTQTHSSLLIIQNKMCRNLEPHSLQIFGNILIQLQLNIVLIQLITWGGLLVIPCY